jgi:hypothetical protein
MCFTNKYLFKKLFIYSHVHTLFGLFLPSAPLLPLPPHFQAEPVLPLSINKYLKICL